MAIAFSQDALLSNGYNSIWNRIPESVNRDARNRLVFGIATPPLPGINTARARFPRT